MVANTFEISLYIVVMITGIHISQEIFALTLRLPTVLVPTSDTKGGLIPQVSHDSLDLEALNSCEE